MGSPLDRLGADGRAMAAAFLDEVPAAVATYDNHGALVGHNRALERLLGFRPSGTADLAFQGPNGEPLDDRSSPIRRALAGGPTVGEVMALRTAEGKTRPVRVSTLPLGSAGGLLLVEDGAERGDTRQILGVVGHDLRNPLSAIRMTAQMLSKPEDLPQERRLNLAKRIVSASGRMESMLKTLMDYARAQAGAAVVLDREPVDAAALARQTVAEQQVIFPSRSIDCQVSGDTTARWDRARVEQVLANVVANACRHGGEDGPVTVTLDGSEAARITIAVHNTGPEIPAAIRARLFQPFTVGTTTPEGRRRSVGLGLFIVKEMVAAHGGTVALSSAPGQGTTVTIRLPRDGSEGDSRVTGG